MQYREYPPGPHLSAVVECLWTLEGHARDLAGAIQPVLPDGRPELVVHLGDPFDRIGEGGGLERQPDVIFAGQLSRQLVLRPTGRMSVLGVRFRPYGAAAFVREPQHRLVGLTLDAGDLSASVAVIADVVRHSARSLQEAVTLMQERLAPVTTTAAIDRRVVQAVAAIARSGGTLAIDDLAGRLDTTRRHLERLFLRSVGLPPKRLARITRFQRALAALEGAGGGARGALAAHACGYADQAHFIRDFRELAGCAPGAHLLGRAELTGFFSGGAPPGASGTSGRAFRVSDANGLTEL
jgi:AraC-like DNA-binding protein